MARGKGQIKGWITKNGVHIPIYDHYTVREGHEPGEKSLKSKFKSNKKESPAKSLKDLKKMYPDLVKTSGATYYIEGLGWYKERTDAFGTTLYNKDWNDEWTRTTFDTLMKEGAHLFKEQDKKDTSDDLRKSIEKDIKSKMESYWKNSEYKDSFVKSDVEDTMERVDRMLNYMKGKDIIAPGDNDIPNEIKWKFAGKDKATGKRASFEFSDSANVQKAKETLRGNGYTVSTGKIFPVNIYNALADTTNMDSYDVRAAEALTKAALSDWKKQQRNK